MSKNSSKPQILFIAAQTGRNSDGGLESSTKIFERLSTDFEWTFITSHDTWFTKRWRSAGAQVAVAPFDEADSRLLKALRFVLWTASALGRSVFRRRPDVIHANDPRAFQVAIIAALCIRRPLLLTVRDTKVEGVPYGRHWEWAAKHCRSIVTLSDEMGEYIHRQIGAPRQKLRTINSMVDLQRLRRPTPEERSVARRRLGMSDGEFTIGCVGAIRDKKNQLGLIEQVVPALLESCPGARLHIFGDHDIQTDEYSRKCEAAVARRGLMDRVIFHGHHDDMATAYQALDAIVVGSRHEGLARCMIEGMASGIPVVSFDVCSAREMLDETGAGIVVRQSDHSGLVGALLDLARNPERRFQMGSRARAVAEMRFSPDRIAEAYRLLYQGTLDS